MLTGKYIATVKKILRVFRQGSYWFTSRPIPSSNYSIARSLNHCTTASCTWSSDVNIQSEWAFFNWPESCESSKAIGRRRVQGVSRTWTPWENG